MGFPFSYQTWPYMMITEDSYHHLTHIASHTPLFQTWIVITMIVGHVPAYVCMYIDVFLIFGFLSIAA